MCRSCPSTAACMRLTAWVRRQQSGGARRCMRHAEGALNCRLSAGVLATVVVCRAGMACRFWVEQQAGRGV